MAASYWDSSQYLNWTFTRQELVDIRRTLAKNTPQLVKSFPLPDRRLLHLFFWHQLAKIGKNIAPGNRQQILATAQVFIRRFFLLVDIRETNPFAVVVTAFYLASKTEECPVHLRQVHADARQLWPDTMVSSSRLAEYEFAMISQMRAHLILHHPYRTLHELRDRFALSNEEMTMAWCIVNDHYVTDLPLLYPPHIIALTAVVLGMVILLTGSAVITNSNIPSVPPPLSPAVPGGPVVGTAGPIPDPVSLLSQQQPTPVAQEQQPPVATPTPTQKEIEPDDGDETMPDIAAEPEPPAVVDSGTGISPPPPSRLQKRSPPPASLPAKPSIAWPAKLSQTKPAKPADGVIAPTSPVGSIKLNRNQLASVIDTFDSGLVTIALPGRMDRILDTIAKSDVNLQDITDCAHEIIVLYQVWDRYKEADCRDSLVNLIRGRGMDS